MLLKDLVLKNRSYRRFYQEEKISRDTLKELIELARLTPSAANRQPLKYLLSTEKESNNRIFPNLSWAGFLKDWPGPEEGERPSAYIVMLGDTEISKNYWCDPGIAAQTILLGAVEKGYGGCIIGAVNREGLRATLNIDPRYEILYVIALGRPREEVVLEEVGPDGDIKYWRDSKQVHHVPKRSLQEIILE